MKLVQFVLKNDKTPRVGIHNGDILDLTAALGVKSALEFIKVPKSFQDTAAKLSQEASEHKIALEDVDLLAPITNPDKVLCIGMNYKDHCEEQNKPIPTEPVVFNKFPSCIVGPYDDIPYPQITQELDWEVELAIVIGKKGFNIPLAQAPEHIFGFTVAHDVSARDWQLKRNAGQWLLGKAMDAFCPLGPALVTPDELGDPHDLHLTCKVNGETKQDSRTTQLVFDTNQIVAWCSQFCTLLPGDVILTGTPPGVGCFMKPPQFLKKGDVVECYIENIGKITNKIV